jgi:hypothetical protein
MLESTVIIAAKESNLKTDTGIAPHATKTITRTALKWTQNLKKSSRKSKKKNPIKLLK